ncbi:hypothetical protein AUP68_06602 [Ilyonectria robusta]
MIDETHLFKKPMLAWLTRKSPSLWIPLVEKVTEWPLALCDSRTVRHDRDFQSSNVVPADRIGESYMAYHHPEHSWYFLSEQAGDEAWVFMSWDSDPHAPQRKCSEQELPSKKQVQNLTIASW